MTETRTEYFLASRADDADDDAPWTVEIKSPYAEADLPYLRGLAGRYAGVTPHRQWGILCRSVTTTTSEMQIAEAPFTMEYGPAMKEA